MKTAEKFAKNLKRIRNEREITQKQLSEALGCSEKAVSKWECARSIPDIEILLELARFLNTGVEALFADIDKVFLLGIDGGGTKTHLILANPDGSVLRELFADCTNPIDIGLEGAKKILKEAIYKLCGDIPFSSVVCFAGIAGGTSAEMKKGLGDFFAEFGFMAVENDSDNKNIIAAGLGESDGITLILGTGVYSFLQKDGKHSITGGKGYLLDNGGSGYNIGRDALATYFREKDGLISPTEITREIESSGEADAQTLLGKVYAGGKKYIASFCRFAYSAAEHGDEAAIDIIRRNMEEAAQFVLANAKKLPQKSIPLVLAGGLTNEPLTIKYLTEALGKEKNFEIKVLDRAPVYGAVALAKKLYEKTKEQ